MKQLLQASLAVNQEPWWQAAAKTPCRDHSLATAGYKLFKA